MASSLDGCNSQSIVKINEVTYKKYYLYRRLNKNDL